VGLTTVSYATNEPSKDKGNKLVALVPPYISILTYEVTDSIAAQYAVDAIAEQAGLIYDWKTSFENANPTIMQMIRPEIRNQSWQEALDKILKPLNLAYTVESGKIIVIRVASLDYNSILLTKTVTLVPPYDSSYPGAPTDRLSVQYAVGAIAKQVGLAYDFAASNRNTDPIARQWIIPSIKNKSGREALDLILKPLKVVYWIDSGKIVLGFLPVQAKSRSTMEAWTKAANKGNVRAQAVLGKRYYSGNEGIAQDFGKALKWLGKAAEKGDLSSQFDLGQIYSAGNGIPKDDGKAFQYFYLAAAGCKGTGSEIESAKKRDEVASHLTPQQLAKAKQWADKWIANFWRKAGNGPYPVGWGITMPEPFVRPAPSYTIDGRRANVQGSVFIQCVIHKEGNADHCKLMKGLGFGLDESAAKALMTQWRFKPGLRDGVPVDAVATIEVPFQMTPNEELKIRQ